jgi:hypothetical protein
MILPCPYESGDTISLYSLEKYPTIFKDLKNTFPVIMAMMSEQENRSISSGEVRKSAKKLEVVDVGCYKVSIARSISELQDIEKDVFTLPKNIEEIMTKYYRKGFAFVICAFGNKDVKAHPIAYESRKPFKDELFVPTRHAHGGSNEVEQHKSYYDHDVYSLCTKMGETDSHFLSLHAEIKRASDLKGDFMYTIQQPTKTMSQIVTTLKSVKIPVPKVTDGDLWKHNIVGMYENKDFVYNLV